MAPQDDEQQALQMKKEDYFRSFRDATRDEDDEAPDPGRQASTKMLEMAANRKRQAPSSGSGSNGLPRSASDTNLAKEDKQLPTQAHDDQGPPSSSAGNARLLPVLMTRHTFSGSPAQARPLAAPTTTTTARTTGKRKREPEVIQLPEGQQIFRGLHFYFFPNTDTNPARKLRISKAREFGAIWEKIYNDAVTHVIVDKAMTFNTLLGYLKLASLSPDVVVVSEDYPAECISFRALMDPRLPQYRVKGHQVEAVKPTASGSDVSLKLKPAPKSVMTRKPETQTSDKRATTPEEDFSGDENAGLQMSAAKSAEGPPVTAVQSSDELESAIKQMRELQGISLDEDGDSRPTSSSGPSPNLEPQGTDGKKRKLQSMQDRFQCMKADNGSNAKGPNAATIAILDQMSHYYDRIGDDWRTRAYRKAIATLRNHPTKVCTKEDALKLPQIGERLATKIEEIAYTNRLRRLENTKADANDQVLQTFMGVYGVGLAQASKWLDAGFTTLDELSQKAQLTENQKIGIAHYEDFNSRIPRTEVEQLGIIVRNALLNFDPSFELIVGGSYRRGAKSSGDIDCIITHTNPCTSGEYIRQVVLDSLVPKLFAKDFLVAELAATSRDDGSKWHGACHLPAAIKPQAPWRRIDLLLVPPSELGAALIYFTGNDIFNRSIRLLASTKGMRLNQRGLYKDVIRGKGRVKLSDGTLVEGRDEKKIFEILGVPWRSAEQRNC